LDAQIKAQLGHAVPDRERLRKELAQHGIDIDRFPTRPSTPTERDKALTQLPKLGAMANVEQLARVFDTVANDVDRRGVAARVAAEPIGRQVCESICNVLCLGKATCEAMVGATCGTEWSILLCAPYQAQLSVATSICRSYNFGCW
jgi:hypothetical protein